LFEKLSSGGKKKVRNRRKGNRFGGKRNSKQIAARRRKGSMEVKNENLSLPEYAVILRTRGNEHLSNAEQAASSSGVLEEKANKIAPWRKGRAIHCSNKKDLSRKRRKEARRNVRKRGRVIRPRETSHTTPEEAESAVLSTGRKKISVSLKGRWDRQSFCPMGDYHSTIGMLSGEKLRKICKAAGNSRAKGKKEGLSNLTGKGRGRGVSFRATSMEKVEKKCLEFLGQTFFPTGSKKEKINGGQTEERKKRVLVRSRGKRGSELGHEGDETRGKEDSLIRKKESWRAWRTNHQNGGGKKKGLLRGRFHYGPYALRRIWISNLVRRRT